MDGNNSLRLIVIAVVVLVLVGAVGLSAFMARRQAVTWVYPPRSTADETPDTQGLDNWQDVTFTSGDGLTLSGWFIRPDASTAARPTVILLHGLSGHRGEMLNEAQMLADAGFSTLLFDLRGHGASEGDKTTLGYSEVEDVRGAVDYLLTRDDVDTEHIGLSGFSLGGVLTLRAAARIPEIQAVAAISAFKTVDDNVTPIVQALTGRAPFPFPAAVMFFVNMETGVNVSEVRAIDDLAAISPRPVLFVHGGQDTIVPVSNSEEMYAAASEPKDLLIVPDAGHGGFLEAAPDEYRERLVGFFSQYLLGESADQG